MGTKMKGLLKGLRYISQIFDEEKEPEMQIGYPTDVKHVAHIGWDGPSVDSPCWMKEFKSPEFQSAPLEATGDHIENPEIKWVSEDSSQRGANSSPRDLPELPKSSRRHSASENPLSGESPRRDSSTKLRQSRRHHSKDSSESVKSTRQPLDPSLESPARNLPDIPKKSRRKKSKDSVNGGSSRSRSKADTSTSTYTSPFSDPGPDTGSILISKNSHELCQTSSMKPHVQEEEKGSSGIS
ncbi:hypothetical protein RJ639_038986 [Escallonia herrerae]|uniref:CRIB domain-containing protein n=1 Tax=Escallonia herrerae TaxID=1293975 RepID=A0AA89B549_9ASTE|nr:hypothetical protein RJ639_038986 [Escallonia herrerae]